MYLCSPKILFVSPVWPTDRAFGGQMRAWHVASTLRKLGPVTLLVVGSEADNADAAARSADEFALAPAVPEHLALNRGPARRFRWAFDPSYLNVHGVVASAQDRARVAGYLDRFDLVWVMNSRTPNILQIWRWPHGHLDLDDIPSTCQAPAVDHPGERWKYQTRRMLLHRRELWFRRRFATLSVCSEADRAYLGGGRIHVIPNGFDRPAQPPVRGPNLDPPRLGFIGLYSHAPNCDGVRWFLRDVWPQIRRAVPGVRFRLVGRDSDGALRPTEPDVDALGWLPDPAGEIASWSAMVVPIRFGGGTRIKVAEAFSRKCPVVATHFGVHGYDLTHGKQLLLADDAEGFAQACVRLVRDPLEGAALAEQAWQDFLDRWSWEAIAPRIVDAAEDCLRCNRKLVPA